MKTIDFVKSEITKKEEKYISQYQGDFVKEIYFGDDVEIFYNKPTLEFSFPDGYVVYGSVDDNGNEIFDKSNSVGTSFTVGYKTPKGYVSQKKLPVEVKDCGNVTLREATELLKFITDANATKFNPFYASVMADAKNAAAWNDVVKDFINDPYDTQ